MSLTAVLSNAVSGLAVAQNALAVTANNVANASTEGYARQIAQQEAAVLDGRGAGARALATTRMVDEYLTVRAREQAARVGRSEVLDAVQEQIQQCLFGAPGDAARGLSSRIAALTSAAQALATGPDQPGLAAGLIGAAQDLARGLATAGAEVQSLRRELDARLSATVAEINGELAQLEQLNRAVARSGPTPGLLDRRDAVLASLAGKLEIAVAVADNGAATVYTRSGQPLLDSALRQLVYDPVAEVGSGTTFGPIRVFRAEDIDPGSGQPIIGALGQTLVSGGLRLALTPQLQADAVPDDAQLIVSSFREGRLQGLIEARDALLPVLADQLGELAGAARFVLNAAHNTANAHPPPERLTGTREDTAGFAGAARGGTAYVAIVDPGTGIAATTVAVDVATAADVPTLAAQLTTALGGLGTATIDGAGRLVLQAAGGYRLALAEGDSRIEVADDAGHVRVYGFSHYFGLNDLLVAEGTDATRLRVRDDLAADPARLARTQLDVQPGGPPTSRLGGAGDSRGAQALAAAFGTPVDTVARGDLPSGRFRLADYAAEIVAVRAGAADRARQTAAIDQALAEDLAARRAEVSGVNLDEELARLVLLQEAYAASARVLQLTNQLFAELLAIVD